VSRTRCNAIGVAALSRDPGRADHSWKRGPPALQRTAEEALRCVRGTRELILPSNHYPPKSLGVNGTSITFHSSYLSAGSIL
jgi:hypothetical protein